MLRSKDLWTYSCSEAKNSVQKESAGAEEKMAKLQYITQVEGSCVKFKYLLEDIANLLRVSNVFVVVEVLSP